MPFPLLLLLLAGGAVAVAASSSSGSKLVTLSPTVFRTRKVPTDPIAYAPPVGIWGARADLMPAKTPEGVPFALTDYTFKRADEAPWYGITVDGRVLEHDQWTFPRYKDWSNAKEGPDRSWGARVTEAVTSYVVPALGVVIGAAGGPVGIGAALALRTWANLARGIPITDAIIDATQKELKTQLEKSQFSAYVKALSSQPMTQAAIRTARSELAKRYLDGGPSQAGALQAFDSAAALARARRLQEAMIENLSTRIDPKYVPGFKRAVREMVPIVDWLYAYAGDVGVKAHDELSLALATQIDAGKA